MVKSRPCQNGACSRGDALLLPSEGREEDELDAEEDVCALCKVHCSYPGTSAEPASEDSLALAYGGWCGPRRDQLAGGVSRRVQAFLQARATVLHCDDIINKKDPVQVGYLLQKLLQHRSPVQVAFLQGAIPLQNTNLFPRLLDFLQLCPVWSVNLGELRFSEEQCGKLAECLRQSGVTHMCAARRQPAADLQRASAAAAARQRAQYQPPKTSRLGCRAHSCGSCGPAPGLQVGCGGCPGPLRTLGAHTGSPVCAGELAGGGATKT